MENYTETDRQNRERWNGAHLAHHLGALSGSPGEEVLRHHRLTNWVAPGMTVLDIGVGLGGMSQHLHSLGCTVDALDVADAAEATVRDYIRRFYLAENIEFLPDEEYDLAISMIVAQHMCERNLRRQIRNVARALKPGGIFSLHLAGATEGPLNNLPGEIPPGMDGAMCRDPDYAIDMILDEAEDCRAELLDHRMEWPQFKSYWYFVRIIKDS